MFNFGYGSILGILILIGDIWAIVNIFNGSLSNERKLIWIIVVALLPVLGLILWFYLRAQGQVVEAGCRLGSPQSDIQGATGGLLLTAAVRFRRAPPMREGQRRHADSRRGARSNFLGAPTGLLMLASIEGDAMRRIAYPRHSQVCATPS
jgi:hypothetical protein